MFITKIYLLPFSKCISLTPSTSSIKFCSYSLSYPFSLHQWHSLFSLFHSVSSSIHNLPYFALSLHKICFSFLLFSFIHSNCFSSAFLLMWMLEKIWLKKHEVNKLLWLESHTRLAILTDQLSQPNLHPPFHNHPIFLSILHFSKIFKLSWIFINTEFLYLLPFLFPS